MTARMLNLELLVGRLVRDTGGERVGRIHAVHAEPEGSDLVVRHYELGGAALLARFGLSILRLAGRPLRIEPLRVPWDQLDLGEPERPRLRCTLAELKAASAPRPPTA